MTKGHNVLGSGEQISGWKKAIAAGAGMLALAACSDDPSDRLGAHQTPTSSAEDHEKVKKNDKEKLISASPRDIDTIQSYAEATLASDLVEIIHDFETQEDVSGYDVTGGGKYQFAVIRELDLKKGRVEIVRSFKNGPTLADNGGPAMWVRTSEFGRPEDARLMTGGREDPSTRIPILEKNYELSGMTLNQTRSHSPQELLELLKDGKVEVTAVGGEYPGYDTPGKSDNWLIISFDKAEGVIKISESGVFREGEESISDFNDEDALDLALNVSASRSIFQQ